MRKFIMTGLLMFASNWLKRFNPYTKATVDLTKLKIAMGYLHAIKAMRLLFISLLVAGVCLVLLLSALVLLHCAVFFYAPWSIEMKMAVTLGCAALYVLAAGVIFAYFFSEDKWMKVFNADKMVDELSGASGALDADEERTELARHSSI